MTITLSGFIDNTGIRATVKRTHSNPNAGEWAKDARHWLVTLRSGRYSMRVAFSQGSAHTEAPTAADVLDCLASDAAGANEVDFENWCAEYGYDTDSRKTNRIYKTIKRQSAKLRAMLGTSNYETLLWNTERN